MAKQTRKIHHLFLAHAKTVAAYARYQQAQPQPVAAGQIGITLNLSPVYAATPSQQNFDLAQLEDGILNRWYLDPVLKGSYPADILTLFNPMNIPPPPPQQQFQPQQPQQQPQYPPQQPRQQQSPVGFTPFVNPPQQKPKMRGPEFDFEDIASKKTN